MSCSGLEAVSGSQWTWTLGVGQDRRDADLHSHQAARKDLRQS